ncbi:uncharacterized protein [Paramisgurnus dabryanus]|uniref:uncharacterized protein n=1 Tax=Paramisgurnus dabryanus TaxID=90735 RepID=UPI0031F3665D
MLYCADRSEYDITNLSRGTLMSYVDRSAQRCRKSNTSWLQYNETLNLRMTANATPPPAGICSSAESEKDIYITQLIHRLETLHMSTVVSTQQVSLQASIPNAQEQEPTTCCSQTKSSEVVKQLNTTQLRMLSHRWHSLGLQPPILRSKQEQVSDHHKSAAETRPPQENIQVTHVMSSSRDESTDETKGMSDSHSSSSDTCNRGLLDGNVIEQCSLNNSNRMSVECEDSDLSDQEKDNIPLSKWTTPVELDLRPDSSELTETGEEKQVYPEVLPVLLESQQKLHVSDPCFTAMVARLLELEKLQAATIQREQAKAVRSRPTTAIIQNANRPRQMESPSNQSISFVLELNMPLGVTLKMSCSIESGGRQEAVSPLARDYTRTQRTMGKTAQTAVSVDKVTRYKTQYHYE